MVMVNDTMEPEAIEIIQHASSFGSDAEMFVQTTTNTAIISIAISLKRIADAVTGVPYDKTPGADNSRCCMGLIDGIMHAIEQGLLAASQRG